MFEKDLALKHPPLHSWDVLMCPLGSSFGTNHLGDQQKGSHQAVSCPPHSLSGISSDRLKVFLFSCTICPRSSDM